VGLSPTQGRWWEYEEGEIVACRKGYIQTEVEICSEYYCIIREGGGGGRGGYVAAIVKVARPRDIAEKPVRTAECFLLGNRHLIFCH
jgi:hypothetical protein